MFRLKLPFLVRLIINATYTPERHGAKGEAKLSRKLNRLLNPQEYTILNDIILPTQYGTTQIDHIVVSRFGVFVIETKNMVGWIFGSENQKTWTKSNRGNKSQFQNPIHQNYRHVQTLRNLLNIRAIHLHSIIAFVGDAEPKTRLPSNVVWDIQAAADLIRSKRITVFSTAQVDEILRTIGRAGIEPTQQVKHAHIQNIKANIHAKRSDFSRCPKCGGKLVVRQNRRTNENFMGCTNFPKCRGTRPISR